MYDQRVEEEGSASKSAIPILPSSPPLSSILSSQANSPPSSIIRPISRYDAPVQYFNDCNDVRNDGSTIIVRLLVHCPSLKLLLSPHVVSRLIQSSSYK